MASQGYRAQLPSSVVKRVVQRQPGVGEAIVEGIGKLGQTLGGVARQNEQVNRQVAEIDQARQRAATVADGVGRFTDVQLGIEEKLQALRDSSQPGAPGYAEQAEEIYRQGWKDFDESLGNDVEVRQHFTAMGARWLEAGISHARDFERVQRVKQVGDQFEKSVDAQSASLFSAPTVDNLQSTLNFFDGAIGVQLVDGNAKQGMRDLVRQKLVSAFFEGTLAKGNYDALETALKSGEFDQWIGGADGKARWISRVAANRDVAARQAEALQNEAKRTAIDGLEAVEARIDAGETVPQADVEKALAVAKASGVEEARLTKFASAGDKAVRANYARGLTTRELEAQADQLEAKRSAGKASDEDLRALDAMNSEIDDRADKGSSALTALWKGGDDERFAAVAQLRSMPMGERWRVADKLGGNSGVLASLPPKNAQTAIRGGSIRKDRPDAFMPVAGGRNGKADPKLAREAFNRFVSLPVMNALGGDYDKVLNTALDLYVGSQADAGDGGSWNEGAFQEAVKIVFGQTLRRDGTKQGGLANIRGRVVELPAAWTGAEFDRGLSRLSFDRAVYADGSPVDKSDVLANYRPVVERQRDDGTVVYRFEDARGRALLGKDAGGAPFRLYVGKTPQEAGTPPQPIDKGNLPLGIRYKVKNQDGSISTVRTISIGTDDGEVLIPTVINNKVVSNDEAIRHFEKTGENFGTFRNVADADAYAEWLHNQHARQLAGGN